MRLQQTGIRSERAPISQAPGRENIPLEVGALRTYQFRTSRLRRAAAVAGLAAALTLGAGGLAGTAFAQTDPGFTAGQTVFVVTDALNLRSAASSSSDVLVTATTGASAAVVAGPVVADGYAWYQVSIDGQTGWMAGEYLGEEAAVATTPDIETATVVTDSGTLNVRVDASLDAEVVGLLSDGTTVTILDGPVSADGYDWYQIETDDVSGWAVSVYLSNGLRSLDNLTVGGEVTVSTDYLNLRTEANTTSDVIVTLETGEAGTILEGPVVADGYTWFQVETDYGTGWLAGEYLTI